MKEWKVLGVVAVYCAISTPLIPWLSEQIAVNALYAFLLLFDAIFVWGVVQLAGWRSDPCPKLGPAAYVLFVLGALAVTMILSSAWLEWISSDPAQASALVGAQNPKPADRHLAGNLAMMLAAPIVEEIIYRLGVLGALSNLLDKPLALLLSSIVFTLVHVDAYPAAFLVPIFLAGIAQGLTYLLLGLPGAIALHLLHNSMPFFAEQLKGRDALALLAISLSIVGIWVFFSRLIRLRKVVFGA